MNTVALTALVRVDPGPAILQIAIGSSRCIIPLELA